MDTPEFKPGLTFDVKITHLDPATQQVVIEMNNNYNGVKGKVERMVLNAKEDMVKTALVALGWTPPDDDGWLPIETAPQDGTRILLLTETQNVTGGTCLREGLWQVDSLDKVGRWKPWLGSNRMTTTETLLPTHWRMKPFPPKF